MGRAKLNRPKNKGEMQLVPLFTFFVLENPAQLEDASSFKPFVLVTAARSLWNSVNKSEADLSKDSFVFGQSVGLSCSDSNCANLVMEKGLSVRSDVHHCESPPVHQSPSADWQKKSLTSLQNSKKLMHITQTLQSLETGFNKLL